MFEIDDSGITVNEFTYSDVYPCAREASTLSDTNPAPTATNTLCIRTHSERQGNGCFTLAFGQCFGEDWIQEILWSWGQIILYPRLMCILEISGPCAPSRTLLSRQYIQCKLRHLWPDPLVPGVRVFYSHRHDVVGIESLVYHCPTPRPPTNMMPIHNDVQSIHGKNNVKH